MQPCFKGPALTDILLTPDTGKEGRKGAFAATPHSLALRNVPGVNASTTLPIIRTMYTYFEEAHQPLVGGGLTLTFMTSLAGRTLRYVAQKSCVTQMQSVCSYHICARRVRYPTTE